MDFVEILRKWKRGLDNYVSYRRFWFLLILILCLFLYVFPSLFYWLSPAPPHYQDLIDRCLEDRLTPFHIEALEFNANIQFITDEAEGDSYLPFVGNGMIGLVISPDSPIYIKSSRTLSLPINWHPIVTVNGGDRSKEAIVTHYLSGVATRYQCIDNGLQVTYHYYAHRTLPYVFVQDIKIVNSNPHPVDFTLSRPKTFESTTRDPQGGIGVQPIISSNEYIVVTGTSDDNGSSKSEKITAVAIATTKLPINFKIGPRETITRQILTTVSIKSLNKWEYFEKKDDIAKESLGLIQKVSKINPVQLKQDHIDVWYKLWNTGLTISVSKATGAINGDKINATIYYVLSNVRSLSSEVNTTHAKKNEVTKQLENVEGCFGGYHHTFQALNLWGSLTSFSEISTIVQFWLLTLEKRGCHKLISTGADGVMQAMVLSFGGFRFSAHHLEFNIHPKFLHRDYFFRRIGYGSQTFINISVTLQENNKAILGVTLDKSDKSYYACDGGCIDDPVQLGNSITYFPVKLTEPVTAILFITPDRRHMELIKHTLHVKEIAEAPAHEHHIIALHRHGHHLGGLPTLFWASVIFLIIIFHLFLCKLVYNEYYGKQDKYRNRYGKSYT